MIAHILAALFPNSHMYSVDYLYLCVYYVAFLLSSYIRIYYYSFFDKNTTLWSVGLKAPTENKTTSVTTHFNKLTKGNNVFIVSVIV